MSVIATAVKHLLAAGVTGDALIAAIAEMEDDRPRDVAADRRRESDRIYQAEKRARRQISADSSDDADEISPLDKSPHTPKINPPAHVHTRDAPARRAGPWPCPEGVNPQHWADFLANRKRKKLTNSVTAHDGVLSDLAEKADDDWPPGRLVQLAAAKGWGSINYPTDGPRHDRRSNGTNGMGRDRGTSGFGSTIDGLGDFVADFASH
jgi:hypothetical protein